MAKLTRPVLIRLTEDEYQKLKKDAQGFKSLSYYLRELIKARQPRLLQKSQIVIPNECEESCTPLIIEDFSFHSK
jgi:predicted CopG family antitoxin